MSVVSYKTILEERPVFLQAGWNHLHREVFAMAYYDDIDDTDKARITSFGRTLKELPRCTTAGEKLMAVFKTELEGFGIFAPAQFYSELLSDVIADNATKVVDFDQDGTRVLKKN